MYTITNILSDVNRGILAHNMIEDKFSYRIVFFVNDGNKGRKNYLDTSYGGLRAALENIIRENLTVTNGIVLAAITVRKNGKSVSLLSRAYGFNLNEYFQKLYGEKEKEHISYNYGRKMVQWC